MHLSFIDTKEEILTLKRKSKHVAPHLHNALEIVCVTNGTLELGVGQELYHMEKGDIGFVFPDIIHHYQIFSPGVNKAVYIISPSFAIGKYAEIIQTMAPDYPIIKAEMVEPEVYRAINAILDTDHMDIAVIQAYLQIVIARCIGKLKLISSDQKQGYNGDQAHRQHRYRKRTGPFVEKWQVQADDTYKCKYQCDG